MWCPGQLCITTPSMFEELENPFGEEDDKMYPTKVGGSHVDEKKFKNRNDCLMFCIKEFFSMVGTELGKGMLYGAIGGAILGAILAAGAHALKWAVIGTIAGAIAPYVGVGAGLILLGMLVYYNKTQYYPCVIYCFKHYSN